MKHRRFLGAALAALCLTAPAQAQECLSRPSIQQKLLPLIVPLGDTLTKVATGKTQADDRARRQAAEVSRLLEALRTAPAGVDGCWRRSQ